MDRFHTAQQSPKNQALYSGNRFSTQHDARQRSPALIVLKEEENNNNNNIYTVEGTLRYTNILIVLVGVAVGRGL